MAIDDAITLASEMHDAYDGTDEAFLNYSIAVAILSDVAQSDACTSEGENAEIESAA